MKGRLIGILVLGVLLAIAAGVSGCGGGDDASADAEPLTKAQFIRKADAVCRKADKDQMTAYLEFQTEKGETLQTKEGREDLILTAGVPFVEEAIEEIKELGIPKGDEELLSGYIEELETALKEAEEDPLAIAEGSGTTPFDAPDAVAAKYGFVACSDFL